MFTENACTSGCKKIKKNNKMSKRLACENKYKRRRRRRRRNRTVARCVRCAMHVQKKRKENVIFHYVRTRTCDKTVLISFIWRARLYSACAIKMNSKRHQPTATAPYDWYIHYMILLYLWCVKLYHINLQTNPNLNFDLFIYLSFINSRRRRRRRLCAVGTW